ncbi:MAG: TIR domain-containing protein [Rhodocyclaceae bacterium]|nr:TIR domain-containing protein [Rhodocyclaceae bacterium]
MPPEPSTPQDARLFISYSRRDADAVRAICEALSAQGRSLWVDWEGIAPSAEWLAEIERGIRAADAFVFFLSPDSLTSTVCAQELALAEQLNKRLVPVVLREAGGSDIPPALARLNWIFLRASDDFDVGLDALARALDTDLAWVHGHTALLVPALAWQDAGRDTSRLLKGGALQQAEAWLATSSGKAPPPAEAHIEFIHASRRAATRRLRLALGGALVGLVTLAVLVVWALIAERRAETARDEAVARRIGADAALVASERAARIETSALLAIEAARRRPALENDAPLRRALRLLATPIDGWSHPFKPISAAVFVDDGATVAYAEGTQVFVRHAGTPETRTLAHAAAVVELVACAGQQRLVSRSRDGRATLWPLDGATTDIALPTSSAVACSADGTLIASGNATGEVSLLAARDGAVLRTLPNTLDGPVAQLRFSADGQWLAASAGPRLRVWRLSDDAPVSALKLRQPIVDLDFAPDNRRVMAASDSAAYLWSLPDNAPLKRLGQLTNVHRARFDPAGQRIALAVGDGRVSVFDARSFERLAEMRHQGPVHQLAFSADGRLLLSASNDGTARLWRLADGSEQLRLAHDDFVTATAFSADGTRLLSAGRDGRLRLWQAKPADRVWLDVPSRVVAAQTATGGKRVSPDARYLLESIGEQAWRLRAHDDSIAPLTLPLAHGAVQFAVSPDQRRLAIAGFDGTVELRALPGGEVLRRVNTVAPADTLGFSPDGRLLLTGARDATLRLWSVADGVERWQQRHARFIFSHAFSRDGTQLATGASDATARVWRVADGALLHTLPHRHDVRALAFDPSGRRLASASSDNLARLWGLDEAKVEHYFEHRFPVLALAFSDDGALLATGASDNIARLWDAASGEERARIETPSAVLAVGFDGADRMRVISGSEWSAHATRSAALIDAACTRLTRNLSPIDWLRHVGGTPAATCPALPPPAL